MIIVVDIRETALINELNQYATDNLKITTSPLDIGDVHFIEDLSGAQPILVLERKTVPDLASSQKDGRYREQRARLLALRGSGTKIGYIVEESAAAFSPTLGRTWCQGKFTETNLQTAITRLQLRYDIPVFHSTSIKDTAQWIRRFANCLQEEPTVFKTGLATTVEEAKNVYTEAIRVKKSSNQTPELVFTSLLQTLPGVGLQAAAAIGVAVEHKVSNLLQKTEDELAAINTGKRKVGKTTAAIIYKTFHEV
jgi:ERCC4-type nuclease